MGRSCIKIYGGPKLVKERNIHGKISKSIRFGWIKKIQKNLADTDIEELLLQISKSVSDVQHQYQLTKTNPSNELQTDQEMMDSVHSMNILIQQLVETLPRNEVENLFEVCPSGSESEFEGVREPKKVSVGCLPTQTTKNEITELFSEIGTVSDVRLKHNSNGTLDGLVEFERHHEAKKALKLNGKLMGNNSLYVTRSANNLRVFFVEGFNPTDSKLTVLKKLEEDIFEMGDVWKTYFPPNESFGYVLVEFPEEIQFTVVQQLNWGVFDGIFVRLANLKKRFGEAHMNIL